MTGFEREDVVLAMRRAGLSSTKLAILFMALAGWRQVEIAEVLGLSQSTVSYHWTDTRRRLIALYHPDTFDIERWEVP